MAAGLAELQRSPVAADPVAAIRDQMANRERHFLHLARAVLENPDHLYRLLFDQAGCSYADLEASVERKGLHQTMRELLEAGVYVTHEEYRGRTEIVRGGRHIRWSADLWRNPAGDGGRNLQATSGSTGNRMVTAVSNEFLLYREGHEWIEIEEMGLRERARVLLGAVLPSSWPIRRIITWHRLGVPTDRWFAPGVEVPWQYRWTTRLLVMQARALGAQAPMPEYLPANDFRPVVRALEQFRSEGRPAYVRTMVSMATRVASTARDQGSNIEGTVFSVSGEALSSAKRALIEGVGAQVVSLYGATEFGTFGFACRALTGTDRVHLYEDNLLLTSYGLPELERETLFVTSLAPRGPRILINVGVDDCATLEEGSCDCLYQKLGMTRQAHSIFSYGKLTSQGITMDAADLVALLEVELPGRFGGHAGDYQLAEVDGAEQSSVVLRVRPGRVDATALDAVREFCLERLGGLSGGSLSRRLWEFTGGLRVVLEDPEETATGKVHAIRLLGARRAS